VRVAARGGEDLLWGELKVAVEPGASWVVVDGPREIPDARPPTWELLLAPMAVGELRLPAFSVGIRDTDGKTGEVATSDLPIVTVVSVLPADDDVQPAPLRGPIGVGGFPWEWVLPLAAPVLGLAAVLAWWGRRRRGRESEYGVAVLKPFEELAALLDRLEGRVGREPAASLCDRMAGGLRRYLERRTSEPAAEMTSFELRLLARRQDWPDPAQRGIHSVMGLSDRVRFGRFPADENEMRRAIETSRETSRCLEEHIAAAESETAELETAG
jgi:hypothetical protein